MPPEETTTLELRDYLRVLRRRKWIIIVTTVVCVGAAFAMTFTASPSYSASTRILVEGGGGSDEAGLQAQNNEIQIMLSPEIRQRIEEQLGRAPEAPSIGGIEGTSVIVVNVSSDDPEHAAETANAYGETYVAVRKERQIKQLEDLKARLQTKIDLANQEIGGIDLSLLSVLPSAPVSGRETDTRVIKRTALLSEVDALQDQISDAQLNQDEIAADTDTRILAAANVPQEAQNRNPLNNILAGLAIGLVLGIALAFLREYLDDRVKTKDDLETATGQTVIGLIPTLPDWKNRQAVQLISLVQPRSAAAEAYRTVRTSVEFLSLDQPIGSLQVTSAMAGEGKTTTLANLAITFARVGQRVIVLCCDLRRPRVHEFFGLSNRVGFTSMLLGDAPADDAIQPVSGDLPIGLVSSGPLAPNPAELLASKRAVSVIEELDSQCDLLLIDSPPVLPVTDAQVISGLVDGVLVVSSSSTSNKRDVRRAVELLHQVDAPIIGAILNNMHSKSEAAYAYYGDNRYYLDAQAPPSNGAPGNGKRAGNRRAAKRAAREER